MQGSHTDILKIHKYTCRPYVFVNHVISRFSNVLLPYLSLTCTSCTRILVIIFHKTEWIGDAGMKFDCGRNDDVDDDDDFSLHYYHILKELSILQNSN